MFVNSPVLMLLAIPAIMLFWIWRYDVNGLQVVIPVDNSLRNQNRLWNPLDNAEGFDRCFAARTGCCRELHYRR